MRMDDKRTLREHESDNQYVRELEEDKGRYRL